MQKPEPDICPLCQNGSTTVLHTAREMFIGTRDEFIYRECRDCGTLSIVDTPDLGAYYPEDYYSYKLSATAALPRRMSSKERLTRKLVAQHYMNRRFPFIKRLLASRPWLTEEMPEYFRLEHPPLGLNSKSAILDIGCGMGSDLLKLRLWQFTNLLGIDPFIKADVVHPAGVTILKKAVTEMTGKFDLIMMHHSFEHVTNPVETLTAIFELLNPNKFALIRIPVVGFAWNEYGINWVQLDAPRHIFLYSEASFRRLAEQVGFTVVKVTFDSNEMQFWGSEQYKNDVPLASESSFLNGIEKSMFKREDIERYSKLADELNRSGQGDQAAFFLKRSTPQRQLR